MTFRVRLNLFFVLLVVAPLLAVGVVLLRTIDGAAQGRVESALASEARAVSAVDRDLRDQADAVARNIATDRRLVEALHAGDLRAVRARALQLLTPATPARRLRITLADGGKVVDVGARTALLPQQNELVSKSDTPLATLQTSVTGPRELASRLADVTGRAIQVRESRSGVVLAGLRDGPPKEDLPSPGRVQSIDGGKWLAVTLREAGFDGESQQIVLLTPGADSHASTGERAALIVTLILFLLLAGGGGLLVSRSLQRQVGLLLEGSRRLGEGDFDHEIPGGGGDDEFAQLTDSFNAMRRQLRGRMDELQDERVRLQAAIERAHTDPLTELGNRRRFDDLLTLAVERAHQDGLPVSLLALDLDHFKAINDAHGHQCGDAVLQATAKALREAVRGEDIAVRLGGEEFAVLLPGTDGPGAAMLAERLRAAVEDLQVAGDDGAVVRVTTSVGIATLQGTDFTGAELVAFADGALYRAKRAGRNRTITADVDAAHG